MERLTCYYLSDLEEHHWGKDSIQTWKDSYCQFDKRLRFLYTHGAMWIGIGLEIKSRSIVHIYVCVILLVIVWLLFCCYVWGAKSLGVVEAAKENEESLGAYKSKWAKLDVVWPTLDERQRCTRNNWDLVGHHIHATHTCWCSTELVKLID